jgi:TrmH family RNA methyltransferase
MPEQQITSRQNPRVKDAARLRERHERDERRQILIDGARELSRAISGGVQLAEVFVCEPLLHTSEARALLQQLRASDAMLLNLSPEVFEKIAFGERAEGLVGVAETPRRQLSDWALPANAFVAILEGVEKPGNIGAVLRSADGAGVSGVIVAGGKTDLYNPNAIRASLGTIFTLPVFAATVEEALAWLRAQKLRLFATRVGASHVYTAVSYREPSAIILGSEAEGLSAAWQADDMTPIHVPMLGVADSLNVSATAAVIFYEALRQRKVGSR